MNAPNEVVTELKSRPALLQIADENEGEKPAFGGNQRWLSSPNGVHGGCGTVAAANILVCLSGAENDRWRSLFPYPEITKETYMQYLEEVYETVTPLSLEVLHRHGPETIKKHLPHSLGLPGIAFFSKRLVRFAQKKGVSLRPVWRDRKRRPLYNTSLKISVGEAADYIKKGLGSGCPVALLNTWNPRLKSVQYMPYHSPEKLLSSQFQYHWVTITQLTEGADSKEYQVEVSSWGSRVTLTLNDFWKKGYSGLVYFQ